MARGRMLNNSVCASLKFHHLPDDVCRLMATWLISHLDYRGVFYADPAMVKSIVFPRRADITLDQVAGYLDAMEEAGLIERFQANGDVWQHWPGFEHNQIGLRADRERTAYPPPDGRVKVNIPPPAPSQNDGSLPEDIQQEAGKVPAEEKLSETQVEKKLSEEPATPAAQAPTSTPSTPKPRTKRQKKPEPTEKQRTSRVMFGALATVCQIDLTVLTDAQRGALNQSERKLRSIASPDDMGEFAEWWAICDWRGQKGQAPRPHQVRETWGQFVKWRDNGKPRPYTRNGKVSKPVKRVPTPISLY